MYEALDTEGRGGTAVQGETPMTEPGGRARRFGLMARLLASAAAIALVFFAGGFLLFLVNVAHYRSAPADQRADAIVVLTGGHARVDEAVRLLNDDMGARLLISGVHPSASRKVLLKTFAVDEAQFACCVDIDHDALDTIGNAAETAQWAADHGFHSLIVVTNDYHMPRSLLELRHAMKGVTLIPHAVFGDENEAVGSEEWVRRYRVLFGEYLKYSAARVRTVLAPVSGSRAAVEKAALSTPN